MHAVVRIAIDHCFSIYIYLHGQGKVLHGLVYYIVIDNALREKVFWHANDRLSVKNFDGENVNELIKIRQIRH